MKRQLKLGFIVNCIAIGTEVVRTPDGRSSKKKRLALVFQLRELKKLY